MRATLMYGAGDVRVETVPDARLIDPTDALARLGTAGRLDPLGDGDLLRQHHDRRRAITKRFSREPT